MEPAVPQILRVDPARPDAAVLYRAADLGQLDREGVVWIGSRHPSFRIPDHAVALDLVPEAGPSLGGALNTVVRVRNVEIFRPVVLSEETLRRAIEDAT